MTVIAELPRVVEDARTIAPTAGDALHIEHFPDGRTSLVVRLLDGGRRGDVTVSGPRTRAIFKDDSHTTSALVLQFKPGRSSSLLGVAANELTDRIVSLEALWGRAGRELSDELLAAHGSRDLLARLSHAIAFRAGRVDEPASARLARRAVRLLESGEDRVERVAEQLGVTARHLRRAFTEHIGIAPKEFARAARLQHALRMAATSRDWVSIAADAGYYDQAHLIADFRELVGLTPGAYAKRADLAGLAARSHVRRAPADTHAT